MLTKSFIFAKNLSEDQEKALWARGITTWESLRKFPDEAAPVIGAKGVAKLIEQTHQCEKAAKSGDFQWFSLNWPMKENWRLWKGFCEPSQYALVDIETTGRTAGYDQITVIGLSDATTTTAYVAGEPQGGDKPLTEFIEGMKGRRLLVTFNGVGFDQPFIEKHFRDRNYRMEQPHLDLIFPARSLGLTGGLKDMEKAVGILRSADIAEVRGGEAITLWGNWRQGDRASYDKLITYCKADCKNLAAFAETIYNRKWAEVYTKHAREIDLGKTLGTQLSLFD